MGGEILVYEGMHYANWGNTEEYGRIAYSGVNGSYAFPNLDAGFYNIAVVMEDEKYQECPSVYESNRSLVLPNYLVPNSTIVSSKPIGGVWKKQGSLDQRGTKVEQDFDTEQPPNPRVTLEGIGIGFKTGQPIHLTIKPHPSNMSRGAGGNHTVLVDGSLRLDIDYSKRKLDV